MYAFCLSCPGATFALQHAGFVPRKWLAAKGLFRVNIKKTILQNKTEMKQHRFKIQDFGKLKSSNRPES